MTVDGAIGIDEKRTQMIREIVSEVLEVELDEMTETSLFKEDHGADSLRAIELLAALERAFDVTIDQAELARMVNLAGVYATLQSSAGWKA
ncbi:acyl carrier protein [Micromonospora sp. NPDC005203]|uniref:acyl carrier protein n=1 Tax=Micromonospora sp. NPDC005203 TaxID=3364226 RepID=UPI00369BC6EE